MKHVRMSSRYFALKKADLRHQLWIQQREHYFVLAIELNNRNHRYLIRLL